MGNEQTDPQALALTHAIALQESSKDGKAPDYNAVGDNGTSHGAYQWQPGNFEAAAKSAGLDPHDRSPVNQDKVAYSEVKSYKDKGYDPGQIASLWNSGSPNNWQNHSGTTTVNGKPLAYDTPKYVHGVQKYYQQLQGSSAGSQPSASGLPGAPTTPKPLLSASDDLSTTAPAPQEDLLSKGLDVAKGVGNFLFPAVGDAYNDITGQNKKTLLQQAGDVGSTALGAATLIPGLDAFAAPLEGARGADLAAEAATKAAPGLLSTVGKSAAIGAGFGATQSLGAGETDPTKIAEGTALGATTGGLVGATGSLISKAADVLPQRIVRSFLPGINQDTAQYAVKKGLGSLPKMLQESDTSVSSLGKSLGSVLSHPQYQTVQATANDILPSVINRFPNAGLNPETVAASLMKIAPLQKNLIEKLASGEGLSLDELHTLNSAIGKNTFKSVFDDPAVKAGKEIGSAFYHSASDFITSKAPETAPIFDQLSKEYPLNAALQKAIRAGQKAKTFNLRDLMALIAGFSTAGPVGAGVAYAGEKALTSPTVNMKTAGLLSKVARPGFKKALPLVTGVTSGLVGGATRGGQNTTP